MLEVKATPRHLHGGGRGFEPLITHQSRYLLTVEIHGEFLLRFQLSRGQFVETSDLTNRSFVQSSMVFLRCFHDTMLNCAKETLHLFFSNISSGQVLDRNF